MGLRANLWALVSITLALLASFANLCGLAFAWGFYALETVADTSVPEHRIAAFVSIALALIFAANCVLLLSSFAVERHAWLPAIGVNALLVLWGVYGYFASLGQSGNVLPPPASVALITLGVISAVPVLIRASGRCRER